MKVSQIMIANVQTCGPQDTLAVAAQIMEEKDVACLPVVDSSNKIVGMLTDRDICMAAHAQGRPLKDIRIVSAMSPDVISCSEDATIREVEQLMRSNSVHRVPVINGDQKVVGIVSITDLTLEAKREVGRRVAEISAEDVMDIIASINERRNPHVVIH